MSIENDDVKYPETEIIRPLIYNRSKFLDDDKPEDKIIRPLHYVEKDKTVEDKVYIILYILNDTEDDVSSKTFSVCMGRTMAYMDIKNKLQSGLSIDVHRSCIITETKQTETSTGDIRYFLIPFDKAISVYAFCIAQSEYFNGDEFDIEDYAEGDIPEDRMDFVNRVYSKEELEYRTMLEDSIKKRQLFNTASIDGTNV